MSKPVLLYVENETAYFGELTDKTWGDDWNDAPYEHNAGPPYKYTDTLRFWGGAYIEAREGRLNSSWSAEDLTHKKLAPWMRRWDDKEPAIWAGTSLSEFKRLIKAAGGRIFVEEK